MNKTIKSIILIATLISLAFGFNAYFAKASELAMLQADVQCQNISNQAWRIQERLWILQDRYGDALEEGNKANKEEFQNLQLKLNILLKQLEKCDEK